MRKALALLVLATVALLVSAPAVAAPRGTVTIKADFISPEGNSPFDRQACEAATGMLQKVGIDARCIPQPFSMFRKTFNTYAEGKNKTPAVYFQSFGNSSGDSSFLLRGASTCQGAWSGVCNKEFDDAVDKATAQDAIPVLLLTHKRDTSALRRLLPVHHLQGTSVGLLVTWQRIQSSRPAFAKTTAGRSFA